jgi:two-component system, cell cycle sensor histidine kinase and response regulator CckA
MVGILVVEDDSAVRGLVAEILRAGGYAVTEAPGAAEARLAARSTQFDLLVCDIVLPDILGAALFNELGRSSPGLRVLYISAYGRDDFGPAAPLLRKPFRVAELLDAAGSALAVPPQDEEQAASA